MVHISFRGDDEDTGKFIRSLSAALKAQSYRILGHDKKFEIPYSRLPCHLREAIEGSWIWIVVFSKNYASSSWCLQELEQVISLCQGAYPYPWMEIYGDAGRFEADMDKVNERRRALTRGYGLSGRRIIAVFYDEVDLKSIAQHIEEQYTRALLEEEPQLREVIKQVATLSGCHLRNDSSGSQVIPYIVKQVKSKIDQQFYDFFGFVGIQFQMEEVEKLLDLSTDDEVGVIGICGMSGIGKPSIVTVLYLKIFHCFDAFCFLPNVSACLKQGDISLQQLFYGHLMTENSEIKDFLDEEFLACERLRKQLVSHSSRWRRSCTTSTRIELS